MVPTTAKHPVLWSDLVRHSGLGRCVWHVEGVFVARATYSASFRHEVELTRFLDFLLSSPTSRPRPACIGGRASTRSSPSTTCPTCGSSSTATTTWLPPSCWPTITRTMSSTDG